MSVFLTITYKVFSGFKDFLGTREEEAHLDQMVPRGRKETKVFLDHLEKVLS